MAVLVPAVLLFSQAWRGLDREADSAGRERQGIEYLEPLNELIIALAEAQSAAVAGTAVPREQLDEALRLVNAADQRLGEELRTRDRWSGLRVGIGAVEARAKGGPSAAYHAYSEVTELLLQLYGKVRETSHLLRDPQADSYQLQDIAAEELPEAVVAVGRLIDLAVIAPSRPASERLAVVADLAAARAAVLDPAADLAAGLEAAVEATTDPGLGPRLLGPLDRFQRAVDAVATETARMAQQPTEVAPATLGRIRADVQAAATELSTVILAELDSLIEARVRAVGGDLRTAVGCLILAVLLGTIPPIAIFRTVRRRRPFETSTPSTAAPVDSTAPAAAPVPARRERAGAAR
jgi:hypothetical protein